jgi:hypothetical protein
VFKPETCTYIQVDNNIEMYVHRLFHLLFHFLFQQMINKTQDESEKGRLSSKQTGLLQTLKGQRMIPTSLHGLNK